MLNRFLTELNRRQVFRVAAAYLVSAWVVMEVAELAVGAFEAPHWVMRLLIVMLVSGFPIAAFFAWAYEITPEGIQRDTGGAPQVAHKLNIVVIVLLALAAGLFVADRVWLRPVAEPTPPSVRAPAQTRPVVAVLPITDLRQGATDPGFANGLHDEILNALAQVAEVSVMSRTSVVGVETTSRRVPEIAADLGATHVVESSLRAVDDDTLRIVVQLIAAAEDDHMFSWVNNFRLEPNSTAAQADIATQVAARVRFMLRPDDWHSGLGFTSNTRAATLYRAGHMELRYGEWESALRDFEQATALDPGFAQAHASAALVLQLLRRPEQLLERERRMALARELEPELPELHLVEAHAAFFRGDNVDALRQLDAIEGALSANTFYRLFRGFILRGLARPVDALAEFETATRIDPYHFWPVSNVGYLNIALRRYGAAERYLAGAVRRWPRSSTLAMWRLHAEFARTGDPVRLAANVEQLRADYALRPDSRRMLYLEVQAAMFARDFERALSALAAYDDEEFTSSSLSGRRLYRDLLELELLAWSGRGDEARTRAAAMLPHLRRQAERATRDDESAIKRLRLGHALALAGEDAAAEAELVALTAELIEFLQRASQAESEYHGGLQDRAALAVWAGRHDAALELLERSLVAPISGVHASVVAVDPVWWPLHANPRFRTLLAEHGQYTLTPPPEVPR